MRHLRDAIEHIQGDIKGSVKNQRIPPLEPGMAHSITLDEDWSHLEIAGQKLAFRISLLR